MKRFNRFILDEAAQQKLTFNRGHAYEFVLAAAMVARFTDRWDDGTPRELDASSVEEVMAGYFMRKGEKEVWTVSAGDGVEDTVEFDGSGLPTDVLAALGEPTIRKDNPDVKKMVTTAIKAVAKNKTLENLSTRVIKNGIEDTVKVVCGGTTGQMSTKSDIDLFVNEKVPKVDALKGIKNVDLRDAGFSVKWGGVEQVGQWSGVNLDDNIIKAFTSFGMKITSGDVMGVAVASGPTSGFVGTGYKGRKDSQVEKDKNIMFNAVRLSFGKISTKNQPVEFRKLVNVNNLIKGIKESISGAPKPKTGKPAEQDIELIRNASSLNRDSYIALGKGLLASAADPKSNLRWVLGTRGNPTMQLHVTVDNETKILFQIRCRYDADPIDKKKTKYKARFRILAELGTDIWDFIAHHQQGMGRSRSSRVRQAPQPRRRRR